MLIDHVRAKLIDFSRQTTPILRQRDKGEQQAIALHFTDFDAVLLVPLGQLLHDILGRDVAVNAIGLFFITLGKLGLLTISGFPHWAVSMLEEFTWRNQSATSQMTVFL
jgi:hypothetical protein